MITHEFNSFKDLKTWIHSQGYTILPHLFCLVIAKPLKNLKMEIVGTIKKENNKYIAIIEGTLAERIGG